jgi:hypothetical protein
MQEHSLSTETGKEADPFLAVRVEYSRKRRANGDRLRIVSPGLSVEKSASYTPLATGKQAEGRCFSVIPVTYKCEVNFWVPEGLKAQCPAVKRTFEAIMFGRHTFLSRSHIIP